jgi:hypothetical protein
MLETANRDYCRETWADGLPTAPGRVRFADGRFRLVRPCSNTGGSRPIYPVGSATWDGDSPTRRNRRRMFACGRPRR